MAYSGPTRFPAHLYDLDNSNPATAQSNLQSLVDGLGTKEHPHVFGPLVIDMAGVQMVTAPNTTKIKQDWVKIVGPGSISPGPGTGDLLFFTNADGPGGLFNCGVTDLGIDMANNGKTALRCYQTPFFTLERTTVERAAADTIRFEGCVGPIIDKVYVRDGVQGQADGLVLTSIPQGETQRAAVTNFRCYSYTGVGIRIQEGVGHAIFGFDLEACGDGGMQITSSLGNVLLGGYTEYNGPSGAGPDIHMIERKTYINDRHLQYNLIGFSYLTSNVGVRIDGDANTQYNYFDMMVLSGDFMISRDVLGTTLGPCMFVNGNLIDEGNDTVKLYCNANSPEMYWKRARGKRLSITVGVPDGGYVDYTSDIGLRFQNVASLSAGPVARKNLAYSVSLPIGATAVDLIFPRVEPDVNYAVLLTCHSGGVALPSGFVPYVVQKRTNGVSIGVSSALGFNVKIDVLIVGL